MSMGRPTALTPAHQIGSNSQRFAADSRRKGGQCCCDGMAVKPKLAGPSTCSNESKFAAGTWRLAKFAACRQGLFLPISMRRVNHTRLQLSPQRDSPAFLKPGTAPRSERHRSCFWHLEPPSLSSPRPICTLLSWAAVVVFCLGSRLWREPCQRARNFPHVSSASLHRRFITVSSHRKGPLRRHNASEAYFNPPFLIVLEQCVSLARPSQPTTARAPGTRLADARMFSNERSIYHVCLEDARPCPSCRASPTAPSCIRRAPLAA